MRRGQLVLAAAAVIAIALTPVLFAYLQLGYHPDITASSEPDVDGREAVAFLDRAVHDAAAETAGDYAWTQRDEKTAAVRTVTDDWIATLETARLDEGVTYGVWYNETAGREWASRNCSRGEGRRFGGCQTDDGIVVQQRAGDAVLLAVAFDVRVDGPTGRTDLTFVLEVGGVGAH